MNVKKNDLAILIKTSAGKNIGSICEVKEFVGIVKWPDMTLYNVWRIEFQRPTQVELLGEDGKFYTTVQTKALAPDDWLRPVSGIPDETLQDEEITA